MFSDFSFIYLLQLIILSGITLFLIYASMVSFFEKEKRAAYIFLLSAGLIVAFEFVITTYFPNNIMYLILSVFLISTIGILFFPLGKIKKELAEPQKKIDERTIMFSRNRLQPGSERHKNYYIEFPQHADNDEKFRKMPGLLSPKSKYFDPYCFNGADVNFMTVDSLHPLVEGTPATAQRQLDKEKVSAFLHEWTNYLGAHSSGITTLQEYHKYSIVGRGADFGKEVVLDHKYAFAFTVEMNKEMMDSAPLAPVVFESSQQYLKAGTIAVQVAQWIRSQGYEARAHIDGNYRVVCPLVARDAGLGELGRMGLLMTPKLGPRVRIAVVTTNMPLEITKVKHDHSMEAFCEICKKCALTCPAAAIPKTEQKEIDGVTRWQINQEKCFAYWCKTGTDCGNCMRVCPYSHPNNFMHNIVRFGIKQNVIFRRIAVKMDDVFYGKNPRPRSNSSWVGKYLK